MGVTFGQRLASERERIARTQTQLAHLVEASKRSVIDWEGDQASPKAVFLERMAREGIDVLYVITGERSKPVADTLTPRQRALLSYYDAADDAGKRFIEAAAIRAGQGDLPRSASSNVKVRADAGIAVAGDMTINHHRELDAKPKGRKPARARGGT